MAVLDYNDLIAKHLSYFPLCQPSDVINLSLSPVRCQAIIIISVEILLIRPVGTNFGEMLT